MDKHITRSYIISELKKFFGVKELVCPHTYARFGEASWQFYDTDFLHTLLVVRRDILKAPMRINDGKTFTQRGNRCNCCSMVKSKTSNYMSTHVLCKAVDADVIGMTAAEARMKIQANANLLPVNIRLEDGVTWLHLDTMAYDKNQKVTLFKA